MSEICSTCLSQDRTLISLDKAKYGSLFNNDTMMIFVEWVCWECAAMFHKIHRFQQQVLHAQECLKSAGDKIENCSPLTSLKCSTLSINDICCDQNSIYDTPIPYKSDLLLNIKSENSLDDISDCQNLKCYLTIDGVKCDEAKIANIDVDVTRIKNECDYISSDEVLEEITVSNIEVTPKVRKKRNTCEKVKLKETSSKKRLNKLSVTKDNYIVIEMTEEEMVAKRESDRQADRYKNKVKYRCELCISGFFHQELYDKHMRIRHSEKAGHHQCSICQTRFSTLGAHREHVSAHYRKYRCRACRHVGYSLAEMVRHDAKEHGVKRFSCKLCHEEFPLRSRLRFHRETMHEAPVKCESCGKMFRTKDSLRVHIKQMHTYTPKPACPVCGARVRNMKSHSRTHEAAPEAAYCAECDQRFTSTASYKSHLKYAARHRAPDTVLSHVCAACDARFATGAGLKKHTLRRHSSVRAHKCERCGKGFEEQCKLKLHILHAHEGVEKPRDKICHICGRGFTTKLTLSNHIRVHTGEKPFRCDICCAAFSQKSSLTTHTRGVHLKIKPRPGRTQHHP